MTDTPRTDAAVHENTFGGVVWVSKELERELAAAQAECARLKDEREIMDEDNISLAEKCAALENDCRCSVCKCASQEDAEAKECGCNAPVCAIEAPDTLATAYEKLHTENAKLREERDAFQNQCIMLRRDRHEMNFERDKLTAAVRELLAAIDGYEKNGNGGTWLIVIQSAHRVRELMK